MARRSKRGPSEKSAVHRVHGGTAPPPLAKTRSGRSETPKPGPVTVRKADGTEQVVPAKEFAKRKATADAKAEAKTLKKGKNRRAKVGSDEQRYREALARYRRGARPADLQELRRIAQRLSWEERLDAALQRIARDDPPPARWR